MDGVPRGNQVVGTGPMPAPTLVDVPVADETIPPSVLWPVGEPSLDAIGDPLRPLAGVGLVAHGRVMPQAAYSL